MSEPFAKVGAYELPALTGNNTGAEIAAWSVAFAEKANAVLAENEALAGTGVALVTSLPGSPREGQEVFLQTAAMATALVVWRLRYRSGASGSFKWEFVGGGWLPSLDNAERTHSAVERVWFADTNCAIEVPVTGKYRVRLRSTLSGSVLMNAFVNLAKATTISTPLLNTSACNSTAPEALWTAIGGEEVIELEAGTSYELTLLSEQTATFHYRGTSVTIQPVAL